MSEDLRRAFDAQGFWITPRPIFSTSDLARFAEIIKEHVATLGSAFADEIDKPHIADRRLLEFLLHPAILDLVSAVCGPDIVLGSSHLFAKRPRIGKATPWHNDTAYLQRFLTAPEQAVNVWISIDGSHPGNGCMRVLPASHRLTLSHLHVPIPDSDQYVLSRHLPDVDDAKAVDVVMRPGHASLHHPSILHGARPNTSETARTGLVGRFLPAYVKVLEPLPQGHELWLARGCSHGLNHYRHWPQATTARGGFPS